MPFLKTALKRSLNNIILCCKQGRWKALVGLGQNEIWRGQNGLVRPVGGDLGLGCPATGQATLGRPHSHCSFLFYLLHRVL